jgi:hypothetical protein
MFFKKKKLKYIKPLFVLLFVFTLLFSSAYNSNVAQASVLNYGYGGYNIGALPCLCSAALIWFTWFLPLHVYRLNYITGPMAIGIPPLTWWFANWMLLIPTTWSLGKAIPLWTCWQPGITGCHPWPTFGHVYMAGSSRPLSPP